MARLTLTAGESVGLSSGNYTIYGTATGTETVTVSVGTVVTLDASFNRGGDVITLTGNAASYSAVRSGSSIILTDASGGSVTIPVGTTAATVKFADVAAGRALVYDTTLGSITLGSQAVSTSTVTVVAGTGGTTTDGARTMVLTAGLNTGTAFAGGSGDDTYDGSTSNSLNTGDVLAGGAGTDTLSATLNGTTAAPNVSGVEIFNLTAGSSNATVSMANVTGVTTVNNVGSTGNLTLTNVGTVPTTVGINTNSNTTTLNFTSAAVAGTADRMTVNLDGVSTTAALELGLVAGATGKVETVELVSSSVANTMNSVSGAALGSTLAISGSQDLTITQALANGVTTVSAGTATGALTFTTGAGDTSVTTGSGNDAVTTGAGNDTISLGAGNDTITSGAGNDNIDAGAGNDRIQFATADFDNNDTVSGGDGTDTIVLTGGVATYADSDFRNVQFVEIITGVGNNDLVVDFNANADAAGVSTITGAGSGNDNITIGSAFDNALRVNVGTGNDTVTAAATSNVSLTISASASSIDANDAFTGGNLSGDVIRLSAGGTATFGGNVTKFETVQVVAGSVADADIVINMNDNMIAGTNSITVDATALSNSNATLTLVSDEANTNATLNVLGGAGADTITGASEKSNFQGGSGNDVFRFATAVLDANDTVNGGDGIDEIRLTNAGTYDDADFTNVRLVEKVSIDAGVTGFNAIFNGNADAAGFSTVTGSGTSNDNITFGSAFDNVLRIDLAGGNDTVSAASSNAVLTVSTDAANYTTADSLTGGAGTADTIRITLAGGGTDNASFGNVAGFETVTIVGNGDNDVVIVMNDTMIAANKAITVDATDLSNSNATLTLTSAETQTTATLTVLGGNGADTITAASERSNFQGGAGNDVFIFDADVLNSNDTINGGDGTDEIRISANHANGVVDSDFVNISNVETLTVSAAGNNVVVTLGANADASGIATITGSGAGNDVITVGAGFDNALRVNLAGNNDRVDASASAATITAATNAANINAGDTLIGGTGSGDTIRLTADNDSTGAVFGSNVSGWELITVVGNNDNDIKITTSDAMTNRAVTLTINADGLSNSNADLTFISGEATDELVTINVTGGNGADLMTGGLEQSNFRGGAGNDTFTFSAANLNAYDSVDGGAGTDTLSVSGAVVDSDFTYISNVEALSSYSGAVSLTLGAAANASGLATVTGNGDDVINIGSGFDRALRVDIGTGNDVVNASGSAAVLTIGATGNIDANDTLIGGSTAGDVIRFTAGVSAVFGGNVSKFETLTVAYAAGANTTSITVHDNMTAAGATLSVSASAENSSSDVFNFNGTAELDGSFNITGSAGNDSISGGLQADTISGGNGADLILGGGGADNLTGGLGSDTITGGAGADTITLTESTDSADYVKFTSNLFSEAGDTIVGFNSNGADVIQFSNSVVFQGDNSNATFQTTTVTGTVGDNDVFIEITTQLSDLTNATSVASNLSGFNVANVAAGETVIFALQDGSDTYLWAFTQDNRAGIQAGDLVLVAKLVGVTDVQNGDFATTS